MEDSTYYLTWYDSNYGDGGHYGEPVSSSQDGSYDDTYYLTNEEVDYDYPNGSRYTNGAIDQDYDGSVSWLGDYTSYFGGFWGKNEAYSEKGYEENGISLEKEESSVYEGDIHGSYYNYNYNDDMGQDYDEDQWPEYEDFSYNSRWDDWEETELYETIFGH
ncbi:hypothetical protein BUALT_Bualt09G0067900 [Buddleja alternifolia]|uniref:Uncharacterized protein n=1 Tax=Buddleja alternifolia TaxID=168488 RepID=A0AAV6XB88_9LAMI|nr:hypothetical protein BUALT_Bualt09G0067900 [Buddleja alternifolia]